MTDFYYFPVELKAREFLAKLLLASEVLASGAPVLIGRRVPYSHRVFKGAKATVLTKSIAPIDEENVAGLVAAGHKVYSLDEEGLLMTNLDFFARKRFSPIIMEQVQGVFCWGGAQCRYLQDFFPGRDNKITVTGNPRAELWANKNFGVYDELVGSLKKKYGRFVLLASTFPVVSPFKKESAVDRLDKFGYIENEDDRKAFQASVDKLARMREAFAQCVFEILQTTDLTVVIRPHPSEDMSFWTERFAHESRVVITGEYSISPWAQAATMLLHNSCTTAIEAASYGVPVVAYLPAGEAHNYEVNLSNLISHQARDVSELMALVKQVADGSIADMPPPPELGDYLMTPSGTCVRLREQMMSAPVDGKAVALGMNFKGLFKDWLKSVWLRLGKTGAIKSSDELRYASGKFPYTPSSEVKALLSAICQRRFPDLEFNVKKIDANLFYLTPK